MDEVWKPVAGYEGVYEVSNFGRVKSLSRRLSTWFGSRYFKERILKASPCKLGYPRVALSDAATGRKKQIDHHVHVLVATAFHGPKPSPHHEVCHGDNDRTNNVATNLRWDTKAGNMSDQYRHGTRIAGEKHHSNVFTNEDVLWIRKSSRTGADIARSFGVSVSTVCRARKGITYRFIG